MKKHFSLSVDKPCAESWSSFTPTASGGFCQSCNKNVVDFTGMSDAQLISYFQNQKSNTCGRFSPGQLKTYKADNRSGSNRLNWFYTSVVSLLLLVMNKSGYAQTQPVKQETEQVKFLTSVDQKTMGTEAEHVVKGRVVDEDNEGLPGINVHLKGSSIGVVTDIEGYFKFPQRLKAGDVLIFSFIGYETKEYIIPKKAPEVIEIPMVFRYCEVELMGEVAVNSVYTKSNSGIRNVWSKIKSLF